MRNGNDAAEERERANLLKNMVGTRRLELLTSTVSIISYPLLTTT